MTAAVYYANTFDVASSSSSSFRWSLRTPRSACASFLWPYFSPFSRLAADRTAVGVTNSFTQTGKAGVQCEGTKVRTRVGVYRCAVERALENADGSEHKTRPNLNKRCLRGPVGLQGVLLNDL